MNKLIPIGIIITLAISFGALQLKANNNEKSIDKHETKIEEAKDKIVEVEKVNMEQTYILRDISKTLDSLNKKIDKSLED